MSRRKDGMPRSPLALAYQRTGVGGFPATKNSSCPNCDEGIRVGQKIELNTLTRAYQHVVCPEPKPVATCPKCFMQLPLSGKCDCE